MGRQNWWPIESPHKVPAMRKALINHAIPGLQVFLLFVNIMETTLKQERKVISHHWKLYCWFNIPYWKTLKKSTLLIPCGENLSVTNGISTQRASNARAFITQFQQDYMSRLCHQRLWKDNLYTTGTTRERTGISSYWKLYRWLGGRLQQLHCKCTGVAAVSHQAIDNVC